MKNFKERINKSKTYNEKQAILKEVAIYYKPQLTKLRSKLESTELLKSSYKNRPTGCPMYRMMDSILTARFTKEELQKAFVLGLIGNNGHSGSIIQNAKDLTDC